MKNMTKEDFLELVFLWGAEGRNAYAGTLELTDKQEEIVAAAYYSAMRQEKEYGAPNDDDYCEEAYEDAAAWLQEFNAAG